VAVPKGGRNAFGFERPSVTKLDNGQVFDYTWFGCSIYLGEGLELELVQ